MYASRRGAALHDGNLGLPIPWGTIAGAGVDIVRTQFFGGGADNWIEHYERTWSGMPCPGAPPAAEAAAAARAAPASIRDKLISALSAANKGFAPTAAELGDANTAHLWVNAAMGGDDCAATSAAGQRIAGIFEGLMAFAASSSGTFPTSAPTSGGGGAGSSPTTGTPTDIGGLYLPHPTPYPPSRLPEGTFSPAPPPPVAIPEIPTDLVPFHAGFLDDLRRIAETAGKEAASRVAEEAIDRIPEEDRARAVEVAAPYVEPYVVDHYRGRVTGGIGEHLPLLAGGALALLVLPQLLGGRRRR